MRFHQKRTSLAALARTCLLFPILILAGFGPAMAQDATQAQAEPILLRLKAATFDPVQGEPSVPAGLRLDSYPERGEGAYIVQFQGPILEAWKEAVGALGGKVMDYLPDYAFLVWMDGTTRAQVEDLGFVRWVGLYQPAYKFSPQLDRSKPLFRVVLFEGSDLADVEGRLSELNTPTQEVPAEQFTLMLPDRNVEDVAAWPEVLWIEERPFYHATNDVAAGILKAPQAWSSGYTALGTTVTVSDTGIDSGIDNPGVTGDIHADFDNRMAHISSWPVINDGCGGCCWNIGANDGAADVDSGHGTHVLGSLGGSGSASSGQFKGLAYQSTLTFQAVEQYVNFTLLCEGFPYYYTDGYYLLGLPEDLGPLFQEAYNWGSRVHSNSWGSPAAGEYTVDSKAVDLFVWSHQDMVILFSAGNEGTDADDSGYVDEDSMGSPATAKNAISVGASDNERLDGGYNPGGPCSTWGTCWPDDYQANPTRDDRISDTRVELAAFSSRGPTNDGRRKPDIVGPGTNIVSSRSQYAPGTLWGVYNSQYLYSGGTSMATPLVAGAAAQVRGYYIEGEGHSPSAALIKATLINSAVDISGYGNSSFEAGKPIPNNHEGWGRVDVGASTSGRRGFHDGDTVGTGGNKLYTYQIGSSATPLKVTLVWSDYPGSEPSGGLVNNLNLVVTSPGGTVYRGNYFSGGWSVPGGSADGMNNVESVYIKNPDQGTWSIRVDGANVPQGPQPFALVITGYLGAPPVFDNAVYLPFVVNNLASGTPPPPPGGWVTLMSEDFEGAFPGAWEVLDDDPGSGLYYWDQRDCRPLSGSYSGWAVGAAGGSSEPLACGSNYPDDTESWMIYGPFSLADASAADLTFALWKDTEFYWDYVFFGASADGWSFYGEEYWENSSGWLNLGLDLAAVPDWGDFTGEPDVWIALVFVSDGNITLPEGVYVDDILLRKYVGGALGSSRTVQERITSSIHTTPGQLTLER